MSNQISQNYILHMKFSEFYLFFHNSCEIWHAFSRTPIRNVLWCYNRRQITSFKPLKNVKKNAIFFKLFWYKVFVAWKLKLLNFLVDSFLNGRYRHIFIPSKFFHLYGFPSWKSSDPKIIGIKTYLFENFSQKKASWKF